MPKHRNWTVLLPVMCLLAYFAVFAIINFRYMTVFCDGDIYADMELARQIWLQKRLFPEGWIYGNQYYTVATPVLAALFYGLTGSLNLGMALATTGMSLLIALSFWWMIRPVAQSKAVGLGSLLLLFAAPMAYGIVVSTWGQLFAILASYYACYLITFFVAAGDVLRAALEPEPRRRLPALLLSLALCFLTGMQSLRETLVLILPLLAVEALMILWRLCKKQPFRRSPLLRVLGCALANLLGYGLMKVLAIPSATIYGQVSLGGASVGEKLREAWHCCRDISGLNTALTQTPGLLFKLYFLFLALLVLLAFCSLFARREGKGQGAQILWLLCVVSLAGVLLAGVLLDITLREIYLFIWFPLTALSFLVAADGWKPGRQNIAIVLLCLLALGNLHASYGPSLRSAGEKDVSYAEDFCQAAREADVRYVYGSWTTVPHLVCFADGGLMAGFWGETPCRVREYINLQSIYGEEENRHALYITAAWDREAFLDAAAAQGVEPTLFGRFGEFEAYRSPVQLMQPAAP